MGKSEYVKGSAALVRRPFLDLVLPVPVGFPTRDDWIVRLAEGIGANMVLGGVLQLYRRHDANRSQFLANRAGHISLADRIESKFRALLGVITGEYVITQR